MRGRPLLRGLRPRLRLAISVVTAVAIVSAACASDGLARLQQQASVLADAPAPLEQAPDQSADDAPATAAVPPTRTAVEPSRPDPTSDPIAAVTVPDVVPVHQPDLLLRPEDASADDVYGIFGASGIEHVAGVAEFEATIVLPEGRSETVSVLAVDPATFRSLTPSITALEPGVWQRLSEGDVAVRHEVAHRLQLELGAPLVLSSLEHGTAMDVRLGALASNGAPPLADLVVPWDVGANLVGVRTNLFVVALDEDEDAGATADELVEMVGGGTAEVLAGPEEHEASLRGGGAAQQFEPFSYLDLGDGLIIIDPNWVSRWIVTVDLPSLGVTRCHRLMIPQLMAALIEIHDAGLAGHFKPEQFAGCWMPRHIDWNPAKPLSMHAWGLAVDINSHDNWLGQTPMMDPRIVEIFQKWGFEWGGHWSRPDGMHFELKHLVQVG
ncbi:MAG: M15 family metallopeptidase [Actinobacteria bacterium]|nr:M15 family metallopeptidase [Actinomycetota bacterium]